MAVIQLAPNMGMSDRLVRGLLGGLLLLDGLTHLKQGSPRRVEVAIGGTFLAYALTGVDPLLKMLGASTIAGAEDHLLNKLKQAAPGQGINPLLTQQAVPVQCPVGIDPKRPIAEALAIR